MYVVLTHMLNKHVHGRFGRFKGEFHTVVQLNPNQIIYLVKLLPRFVKMIKFSFSSLIALCFKNVTYLCRQLEKFTPF